MPYSILLVDGFSCLGFSLSAGWPWSRRWERERDETEADDAQRSTGEVLGFDGGGSLVVTGLLTLITIR
jgi:hypothetical protein